MRVAESEGMLRRVRLSHGHAVLARIATRLIKRSGFKLYEASAPHRFTILLQNLQNNIFT